MTARGPISLARLERCMDTLCRIMASEEPEEAERLVPIYLRLEREIATVHLVGTALATAQRRAELFSTK